MAYGIRLHVWGDYACFTRPEMKAERVSYDVMTPSAARGILEALHWKPAITWVIDAIHVLNPVRFDTIRRNELSATLAVNLSPSTLCIEDSKMRQQRATLLLRDVAYVIEAHFVFTAQRGPDDNEGKHLDIFNRRARAGQCYHRPYLGCREFPAHFRLLEANETTPHSALQGTQDMGWMLYDLDFANGNAPMFYRPTMLNGVIYVQNDRGGLA